MRLSFRRFILLVTLVAGPPLAAQSIFDLHVRENLAVRGKPSKSSPVISELVQGDVVLVSRRTYGPFHKVLIIHQGARRPGYVESSQIQRSLIKVRLEKPRYRDGRGWGLAVFSSYLRQESREIQTSGEDTYDVTELSSSSMSFALFADFPMAERFVLRPYFALRKTSFTGQATLRNGSGAAAEVAVDHSFNSLGVLLKYYPLRRSNWWVNGGGELAKGSSVEVALGGSPLPVEQEDVPFFTFFLLGVGWDIPIAGQFFLQPELRLVRVVNSDPTITGLEGMLGVSYSLPP